MTIREADVAKSSLMDAARRKRIQRYKMGIKVLIVILILLPTILCIYLLIRVNSLERKLETSYAFAARQTATGVANLSNPGAQQLSEEEQAKAAAVEKEILENKEVVQDVQDAKKDHYTDEQMEQKRVYLTFDDGPSENTDAILDLLAEYNCKATFFVVMRTDEASLASYKRIVEEGHTLGMHSASHVYSQIYSSEEAYEADLLQLQDYLEQTTGIHCKFYRFPGGSSNTVSDIDINDCITFLTEQDIQYFDWNVVSGDADGNGISTSVLINNCIKGIDSLDKSVILLHDAGLKRTTVAALPTILQHIVDIGAVALPLTETTEPIHHKINK